MPLTDQEAREELRYAVRRYLAARPTAALTLDMITHGLRAKGCGADQKEVFAQCLYWTGTQPAQVKVVQPEHGSTKAFQITSAGIVADERGE
jgi:hypothetical protein